MGSDRLLQQEGVSLEPLNGKHQRLQIGSNSVIYVASKGEYLGALMLAIAVGIDPLAATLVNNGSTVIAGLNGLRPLLTDSEEIDQLAISLDSDSQEQDSDSCLNLEVVEPPTFEIAVNLPQPLETNTDVSHLGVSESSNGFNNHPHPVMNGSHKVKTEPLTAIALAHRLKVSATTISRRKLKSDFSQWTCTHDPDGISWTYSKQSRLFMAG